MPASKKEAKEFVKRWQKRLAAIPAGSNNEQQDTQKFWVDLLINVLGIPSNTIDSFVDFERKVRGRRIDVFVSDHNFLCEQKSWGIDLDKPEPRNGGMETPLQQAMWYARHLPYSERPRWVMTCNFGTFRLYDLDNERPEDTVQEFSLEELPDSLYLLSFLTSNETSRLHKEQQLSIEAGAYVSRLYDALAKQYHHIEEKDERAQEEQRSLNVLITRIIFLLYAEDADLLQSHQAFGRYCEGDPAVPAPAHGLVGLEEGAGQTPPVPGQLPEVQGLPLAAQQQGQLHPRGLPEQHLHLGRRPERVRQEVPRLAGGGRVSPQLRGACPACWV